MSRPVREGPVVLCPTQATNAADVFGELGTI